MLAGPAADGGNGLGATEGDWSGAGGPAENWSAPAASNGGGLPWAGTDEPEEGYE